jgi:hypothetical protein
MKPSNFMRSIEDVNSIVTAIDNTIRFPETLDSQIETYIGHIELFKDYILSSKDSPELLHRIRNDRLDTKTRMSLLKLFRRCVSPVLDTESTKKLKKISTESLVSNFGHTFKNIYLLENQFSNMTEGYKLALCALLGEYDTRGSSGYALTGLFFDWFNDKFSEEMVIEGPRGAGRDIELNTLFSQFEGQYPCDFVIRNKKTLEALAIGFARYDSTRGGAQSDDRTGGNSYKVSKAKEYCEKSNDSIRIIFLSDGPGLSHGDTWEETCALDGSWLDHVRVTTLKTADLRITREWLLSVASNRS